MSSSSPSREPLSGVIRQNKKIVGAVCLPEEDLVKFIEEFNNCYGPLSMHIDAPATGPIPAEIIFPVGARRVRRGAQQSVEGGLDTPPCIEN